MFSIHTLANGTRVLLAPSNDTQAVCVEALFPVGSRHETQALSGASHFIEHLMFKGTQRRPTTLHISRDLDRIGAEYNAFTGKDYTGYYIKASAEHLDLALDMLADMLYSSTFKLVEFDRERKVILEEIHMYEDDPRRSIEDTYEELLFRGHPLARLISGTEQTMLGITRPHLLAYRDRHYQPARCIVSIAGKVGEHALEVAERTFGAVRARKRPVPAAPSFTQRPRGPMVQLQKKETAQAHLALGVPTFGVEDARAYPLGLLANILGGTMSSRLFIAVRERRGLAYSVHASSDHYADAGAFTVTAGLDPARTTQALRVIVAELKRVRDRGVTAEELSRAKENTEGRIVLGLEDSSARADWYGKQALLRKEVLTPVERIARLMAVERDAVAAVARDVLRGDRLHLAVIGDFTEKDAAKWKGMLTL
ncbi:MAG: pitrilysin family protein [bacterium]|nr:pitrilysin family protein [bacterium]